MTLPTSDILRPSWTCAPDRPEPPASRLLPRWLPWVLLGAGVLFKLRLLATSQGIADGDEAVEGLMARHLLLFGEHAIYPWGVRYGAGAGLEVQLAAILFKWLGDSSFTLKSTGLIFWLGCLYLLVSASASRYGAWTSALAGMLYAAAPQSAQWSFKVAGGHQVAVLLSLLLFFTWARKWSANWIVLLAPLAAIAHPIALPFAAGFASASIASAESPARWRLFALLVLSSALCALLLWPREQSVHDPAAFAPLQILRAFPSLLLALESPNLNSAAAPAGFALAAALPWLGASLGAALWCARRERALAFLFLCAATTAFLVKPGELAPRHLLLLWPLGALAIARLLSTLGARWQALLGALLVISGLSVQLLESRSPAFFGPGPQRFGVDRENVRGLVRELESHGVREVCSADPMLQWNLMFESHESVIARSRNPLDRRPDFAHQVDEARAAGLPVAMVVPAPHGPSDTLRRYQIIFSPEARQLDAVCPASH